jgi:hypothetical protein
MKAYLPLIPYYANRWIYKGYHNAWENAGMEVITPQMRIDIPSKHETSLVSAVPNNEELQEDYIIMTLDSLIGPDQLLAVSKSYKTFVFVQPNKWPPPWGTHVNFTSLAKDNIINELNKMNNVHLWTFGDSIPEYYFKWKLVHTIPLAFDSIGYRPIENHDYKKFDISFVGGWADNGFDEKRKIMIDIFSKFMKSGRTCGFFVGKNLTHEQECQVLYNSKVTLNIHDVYQRTLGFDTNERTFKSLGLNGCLVSDTVNQLSNIFPELKTSLEADELVQLTKDYLSLTEVELNDIKENNRQMILDNHCYAHRVQSLLKL